MDKRGKWKGINKYTEIAKCKGCTRSNISTRAKDPTAIEDLNAFDLYTTVKKCNLTLEDAHQALIMFYEVKKHIKEKI